MLLRKHILALIFALFSLSLAPSWAQDEMTGEASATEESAELPKKKKGKKAKKAKKAAEDEAAEMSVVASSLSQLKTLKGKPNYKADYYVYMCSASWCRFCCECMPVAVDEYKKMRRTKRVEFILINGDQSEKAAKNYAKTYKAKFPYIMFDEVKNAKFGNLPGSSSAIGFPSAAVVAKDGKVIASAVGAGNVKALLADWKKNTLDKEEKASD